MYKTLLIGSDHAGFELKEKIKQAFPEIQWQDVGPQDGQNSVDYPDFASQLSLEVQRQSVPGILVCGSGQGMCMRANKYPKIRAALVWDEESAKLAREHNDANVLCLGGRKIEHSLAIKLVKIFLNTSFAGGRHLLRVEKISKPVV